MEDGTIADDQITASSNHSVANSDTLNFEPWRARPSGSLYWRPHENTLDMLQDQWIQVDFLEPVIITGIQTQGNDQSDITIRRWISKLQVQTGNSVDTLTYITNLNSTHQIFSANTNYNQFVMVEFPEPISARYLRIVPTECENKCGLRFEVFGCRLVNECAFDQDICDTNAECHDKDNGYQCTCNSGFIGDGFQCAVENSTTSGTGTPSTSTSTPLSHSNREYIGITVGGICLILLTALIIMCLVKRKSQRKTTPPIGEPGYLEPKPKMDEEPWNPYIGLSGNQPPASETEYDTGLINLAAINSNESEYEVSLDQTPPPIGENGYLEPMPNKGEEPGNTYTKLRGNQPAASEKKYDTSLINSAAINPTNSNESEYEVSLDKTLPSIGENGYLEPRPNKDEEPEITYTKLRGNQLVASKTKYNTSLINSAAINPITSNESQYEVSLDKTPPHIGENGYLDPRPTKGEEPWNPYTELSGNQPAAS
ncbi:uncharacterized protein [Amphiura filiformis]|uniref:uncharacterized protein n=1 Tax=Amphiura filiformis TaxID=82378 RepID=UPI003B227CE3